jgi:hypothetical protein
VVLCCKPVAVGALEMPRFGVKRYLFAFADLFHEDGRLFIRNPEIVRFRFKIGLSFVICTRLPARVLAPFLTYDVYHDKRAEA